VQQNLPFVRSAQPHLCRVQLIEQPGSLQHCHGIDQPRRTDITNQGDGMSSQLSPESLRAMGASGGPRQFWFTKRHDRPLARITIEVDFSEADEWHVWARDTADDVVCLAINPTVDQLRSLLNGVGWELKEAA
jgi:hypothetical protein